MNKKTKKALEEFVFKVSMEGLAYTIQNYPPSKHCPNDLVEAVEIASDALERVQMFLDEYMEEYDIEWD